ncbi:MAG: class I SAM-dependent methyltransferase [Magnetococcales bacterium]|nr:class I SAM-dependent methyltransferase [Magnetococcales bacterium]
MKSLVLKPGREKSVLRRHPWIFSGAVQRLEGDPGLGETITILDAKGRALALAAYSPQSRIPARIWSFDPGEEIAPAFFREKMRRSLERRRDWLGGWDGEGACRLVNAESDGLPGVTIDRYGEWLVGQFTAAGAERWKGEFAAGMLELLPGRGFLERSGGESRGLEGLPESVGPLAGERVPASIRIREHGLLYEVDPWNGHKTGFYLDQRENRLLLRTGVEGGKVLNAFAYTGGFGLNAALGGASHVTHLDSSATALAAAAANARINDLAEARFTGVKGNAFQVMRQWDESGVRFEVIVLDPPKLADSQAAVVRAARAYKDMNRLAFRLLSPGGHLFTFSCSGRLSPELFQKVVADAAVDAGREAVIRKYLSQSEDHPVDLGFPEGHYLKGLLCQVG